MSRRCRVGGVPEHFNLPWYQAAERGLFDDAEFEYQWEPYPEGTGAMLRDLEEGDLDVAVLLTEGIATHIATGGDGAILGTYVSSPLIWGIHVHAESSFEDVTSLERARFAISRPRSGSHLMAFVLAEQQGWEPERLRFVEVGHLVGAREAMQAQEADVFLWEKFTTKPVVDSGEWRRVGTCHAPWPPFVLASRRGFAEERREDALVLMERIRPLCEAMHQEREATVADIVDRFGQRPEDVEQWLSDTEWVCEPGLDEEAIAQVLQRLAGQGVLDPDGLPEPADLL